MARDCIAGPPWRSMSIAFTPRRPNWLASIRPVGPAPTISTSTFITACPRHCTRVSRRHSAIGLKYGDMNVGLIGWRGMVGSVLVERMLAERDFDLIDPVFF